MSRVSAATEESARGTRVAAAKSFLSPARDARASDLAQSSAAARVDALLSLCSGPAALVSQNTNTTQILLFTPV